MPHGRVAQYIGMTKILWPILVFVLQNIESEKIALQMSLITIIIYLMQKVIALFHISKDHQIKSSPILKANHLNKIKI